MNKIEQNELDTLPDRYIPLTAWQYFWYSILYMVPIIGFIFLCIHSCSNFNINLRNFARSHFCIYIIIFSIAIVVLIISVLLTLRGA